MFLVPYFEPPFSDDDQNVNVSIPVDQELPIGYGPSGWPAWEYGLRAREDIDVGFIKLFLSTRLAQLSHIKQHSAFDASPGRYANAVGSEVDFAWCTITIPVIQRRSPPCSSAS
jgi:hypothetical protein